MQLLKRNQKEMMYKAFNGSTSMITDSGGFKTGEYEVGYGSLSTFYAYTTPSRGETSNEMFGKDLDYDKIMYVPLDCGINEYALLWVDASSTASNDYVVQKVAESLNHKAIAIKKVR